MIKSNPLRHSHPPISAATTGIGAASISSGVGVAGLTTSGHRPDVSLPLGWWAVLVTGGLMSMWIASTFRTFPLPLLCFAAAVFFGHRFDGRIGSGELKISSLRRFLIAVSAAALVFGLRMSSLVNPGFANSLDLFAHTCWAAAMALWATRFRRGHDAMLPLGLAATMATMTIGGVSPLVGGQISSGVITILAIVLVSTWLGRIGGSVRLAMASMPPGPATGGSAIGGPAIGGLAIGNAAIGNAAGRDRPGGGFDRQESVAANPPIFSGPIFLKLAIVAIMVASTVLVCRGVHRGLPAFRDAMRISVSQTMQHVDTRLQLGMGQYVVGGTLGNVAAQMQQSPTAPALRVDCQMTPGYMRGNVFTRYQSGTWRRGGTAPLRRDESRTLYPIAGTRNLRGATFAWDDPSTIASFANAADPQGPGALGGPQKIETIDLTVRPFPEKGIRIFSPMAATTIRASSNKIAVDSMRVIVPGTVEVTSPYHFKAIPGGVVSPDARQEPSYLSVPSNLRAMLTRKSSTWAANVGDPRLAAMRVSEGFRREFLYSLVPQVDTRAPEPLADFLNYKRAANCEYFASATALILRCVGVPTRYVTGYAVDSRDDENDYWLARNRDAHAWVEAYDYKSRQWFIVESTPGQTTRPLGEEQTDLESSGGGRTEQDDDLAAGGFFAQIDLWYRTFSLVRTIEQAGPLLWTCMAGLVAAAIWLRRRALLARLPIEERIAIAKRRKIERGLKKITGLRRLDCETLHQFAQRSAQCEVDPSRQSDLARRVDELIAFANSRFRDPSPTNATAG